MWLAFNAPGAPPKEKPPWLAAPAGAAPNAAAADEAPPEKAGQVGGKHLDVETATQVSTSFIPLVLVRAWWHYSIMCAVLLSSHDAMDDSGKASS